MAVIACAGSGTQTSTVPDEPSPPSSDEPGGLPPNAPAAGAGSPDEHFTGSG